MRRGSKKLLRLAGLFVAVVSCAAIHAAADDSLISNGGFENGTADWALFVPADSKGKNCRYDTVGDNPHSGINCLILQSDDFARYAVNPYHVIPVQPGEHYHVSVWFRADPAAQVSPNTFGFFVRLTLALGTGNVDGHFLYILLGNEVTGNPAPSSANVTLPTKWTQTEAVVEIPAGVDSMSPQLFAWKTKGAIFADDFSIEKVDPSTPVTPLQNAP